MSVTAASPADTTPARVPDVAVSLIRTWVPYAVGALVAWLAASRHVLVPAHASAAAGIAAGGVCASAYYALARLLEHVKGAAIPLRLLRSVGRYMLGGVVAKPAYLSDADYANVRKWLASAAAGRAPGFVP